MIAKDHHFNTPEEVAGYLRQALIIVAELEPPEDLRVVCFGKAVELVSGKQVFFEQPAMIPNLRPH